MKRPYYIFSSGRLQRHQDTVYLRPFEALGDGADDDLAPSGPDLDDIAFHSGCLLEDLDAESEFSLASPPDLNVPYSPRPTMGKRPLAIHDMDSLYLFGECDFNARFFNFLGRSRVPIHFFNWFGFYTGTFWPRQEVVSGDLTVKQALFFADETKRLQLARLLVEGASNNILRNLKYYGAASRGRDTTPFIEAIEALQSLLPSASGVNEVMGIEGSIRKKYYESWPIILSPSWASFTKRVKRPPDNPVNALISFGNSLCYTLCLSEIYRTPLNPTISFLHTPGARRFSLALDISEIWKPILVDRMLFKMINNGEVRPEHFDENLNFCTLKERGRKRVVEEWDKRLKETFRHRGLGKNVSFRRAVRLECYKLEKHLLGIEPYEPFKIWW